MQGAEHTPGRVDRSLIGTAVVLLVGIGILSGGFFSGSSLTLYVGLLVIVAGVLNGVRQILARSPKA